MVLLNKKQGDQRILTHMLKANFEDDKFPKAGMVCLIQKWDDGRYAVFPKNPMESYYKMVESEEKLHELFTEEK